MRLEWLPGAVRNLDDQLDRIGARNPAATIRAGNAVERAVARLADHPHSGRPGRLEGTRELVVNGTPFVIAYRIERNAVVVLRPMHGAHVGPERCDARSLSLGCLDFRQQGPGAAHGSA